MNTYTRLKNMYGFWQVYATTNSLKVIYDVTKTVLVSIISGHD